MLLFSAFLPKDFKIEKSLTINKPKADVFAYLKSLEKSKEWQLWDKKNPNATINIKGTDGNVGAILSWSKNSNSIFDEQEITNIVEGERVDFEIRFKQPINEQFKESFFEHFKQLIRIKTFPYFTTQTIDQNQTQVTWGATGRIQVPLNIFYYFGHGLLEKIFESELAEIKKNLEQQP